MESIITNLESAFMWIGLIVTAATAIVAALEKIAQVTPTTKDDEYIGTAKKWLSAAAAVLDKVSVWATKK